MKKYLSSYAFTLIEVMVSAAILSIVVAVLLHILSTSMTTWSVTQGKIEVDVEGRSGYLLLMQDIDNVVLTKSLNLWPSLKTNNGMVFLRFLTTKPSDYQSPSEGDVGDVCYVEYHLDPEQRVLFRSFFASKWTYENVILKNDFPSPNPQSSEILSTNLLRDFRDASRGSPLYSEANTNSFVILATNNPSARGTIMPYQGNYTSSNPPVGIEVNLAATDMTSSQNPQLLENPNYKLRNSGYYSFRLSFPSFNNF